MNKAELVRSIAAKAGVSNALAEKCLDSFIETVTEALKEKYEDVRLMGFGTFKIVQRAARTGRDPKTGKTIKIPARDVVKFIPGKDLRLEEKK